MSKKFIKLLMESKYPLRDKNGDSWQIQTFCDTCGGPQEGNVGDPCIDQYDCGGHIKKGIVSNYWWNKDRKNKYIPL